MLEEVFDSPIVKFVETGPQEYYFRQDNAPSHKSRESMRCVLKKTMFECYQDPVFRPVTHIKFITHFKE